MHFVFLPPHFFLVGAGGALILLATLGAGEGGTGAQWALPSPGLMTRATVLDAVDSSDSAETLCVRVPAPGGITACAVSTVEVRRRPATRWFDGAGGDRPASAKKARRSDMLPQFLPI